MKGLKLSASEELHFQCDNNNYYGITEHNDTS